MNQDTHEMLARVERSGISSADAYALRRIAMTLRSWYERECGVDGGCIIRDETTERPYFQSARSGQKFPIRDAENGALARLKTIMERYPDKRAYIQTDPRGAALYILRPGDVPEGATPES